MNKDSIYRIIGYNGEYNASVKKAIRKLLKENHPDNNGDSKVFNLISEVKRELEENRVSFDYKTNKSSIKKNEDIDYSYCSLMLKNIAIEKDMYTKELELKKEELASVISDYKKIYKDSIDLESYLLSNSTNLDKLKNIKILCIIFILFATAAFFTSIWTKSMLFLAIFVLLVIICVIIIHKAFYIMQLITKANHKKLKSYVGVNSKIRHNQSKQNDINKEIHDIKKKINNLENDRRFYDNILNNR